MFGKTPVWKMFFTCVLKSVIERAIAVPNKFFYFLFPVSERIREAEKPSALAKYSPMSVGRVSAKIAEKQSTSSSSKDRTKRDQDEAVVDNRHNRDLGLEEPSPKRSKRDETRPEDRESSSSSKEAHKKTEHGSKDATEKTDREEKESRNRRKDREEKLQTLAQKRSSDKKSRKEGDEGKDEERRRRAEKEREERRKAESTAKPKRKRKPFHRLLEDVVFVLSGYQNPERASYRSHALAMGAKYSQDWHDGRCTHLV